MSTKWNGLTLLAAAMLLGAPLAFAEAASVEAQTCDKAKTEACDKVAECPIEARGCNKAKKQDCAESKACDKVKTEACEKTTSCGRQAKAACGAEKACGK